MKCAYCGNEIQEGSEFAADGEYFCSSLHRTLYNNQVIAGSAGESGGPAQAKGKHRASVKVWGLILAAIFTAIGSLVGTKLAGNLFGSGTSVDEQLMQVAKEINKNCPITVDKDTRLDNTMASVGKRFTYSYTLTSWAAEEIDLTALQNYLRPRIINSAKTSPDMKYLRDNSVTIVYRYLDKTGRFIFDITVTPADYQ